ncbi:hypothetical protein B0T16DRAFT_457231 [Cercophora newfieldiana]|uniref:Nudix hydrolase domain-containing protein n=1 Tax=Cercophora newfieldiana TaxID=92897 RepID=A0AA39YF38_9PEZI|nr:hypothetical protein B0T16DRAFT_457231 [Cercophora newfieldiana]
MPPSDSGPILAGVPHRKVGAPSATVKSYADRFAFRIVAFNPSGQIAISHPWNTPPKHRLPGGFIDSPSNLDAAARHELEWETGGRIRLQEGPPVASTEEWQSVEEVGVRQITVCYLAELVETVEEDGVTDEMLNAKLKLEWMGVEEARKAVSGEEPTTEVGRWIRERDWFFLDVATAGLKSQE